ncbi:MAG TPA: ATP synthase subunit I [Candidatus Binatia bacterium]|nr:ATP synthase subunit I [Candidatus Binatia bacterium]
MPEPTSAFAESFLDRALPRIRKFLLALGGVGTVACAGFFRWPVTAGFIAGAVISYVNQLWLERAVIALGERITAGASRERGGGIVFRALLRYVLIAAGAYVIFNVSLAGLYGFLGGVCLPVAAIACEVAVELFVMLRRGA